ncbi:MAG: hypothetical protein P4M11_07135, partial [Candidatus Pacebacteria bacterium]|nr:hypothetical protein [Candidatus Paceibacterota bacterium]
MRDRLLLRRSARAAQFASHHAFSLSPSPSLSSMPTPAQYPPGVWIHQTGPVTILQPPALTNTVPDSALAAGVSSQSSHGTAAATTPPKENPWLASRTSKEVRILSSVMEEDDHQAEVAAAPSPMLPVQATPPPQSTVVLPSPAGSEASPPTGTPAASPLNPQNPDAATTSASPQLRPSKLDFDSLSAAAEVPLA